MNRCPLCNWDILHGQCSNMYQCRYAGPGLTPQEIADQARGHELGQLSPGDTHNDAGYYDADMDFA